MKTAGKILRLEGCMSKGELVRISKKIRALKKTPEESFIGFICGAKQIEVVNVDGVDVLWIQIPDIRESEVEFIEQEMEKFKGMPTIVSNASISIKEI